MPFKSLAQERWAHTEAGEKALGGPEKVAEWDSASKGLKLPDKVSGVNRKIEAMKNYAARLQGENK